MIKKVRLLLEAVNNYFFDVPRLVRGIQLEFYVNKMYVFFAIFLDAANKSRHVGILQKNFKHALACIGLLFTTQIVLANEMAMQPVSIDINNKARLQRGAKLFMNYCSGCHSLKYMRYNRIAEDLDLTDIGGKIDKNLLNNLIFTQSSQYDPIKIAMPLEDAKQWFGVVPPDLSLIAKVRGDVWLYNYLKSFYSDNSRPFGVNNLLVPNVAMPNVLEPLIGQMILVPNNESHLSSLLLVRQGQMPPVQIDEAIEDLVTFLVYVAEPTKLVRYRIGFFVIIFLCILFIAAYLLKKVYWRQLN